MDFRVLLTTFGMIFLAELGDKTQLATFSFAAGTQSRMAVFIGSATALVLTSLMAVLFGSVLDRLVPANYIRVGSGVLFVLIGLWMVFLPGGNR